MSVPETRKVVNRQVAQLLDRSAAFRALPEAQRRGPIGQAGHDHGDDGDRRHLHDHVELYLAVGEAAPEQAPENGATAPASPAVPFAEGTYEIGCIGCIFEDPDATSCQTAVKVGESVYVLEGEGVPIAHSTGLCDHSKQAVIAGELKDGVVHVTKFEIVE